MFSEKGPISGRNSCDCEVLNSMVFDFNLNQILTILLSRAKGLAQCSNCSSNANLFWRATISRIRAMEIVIKLQT